MTAFATPFTAVLMLVLACVCWGVGFPLMKALGQWWCAAAPGISTPAVAAGTMAWRFLGAGLILALVLAPRLRAVTAAEWRQAAWLAVFTGVGIGLQMDALAYTSASTSAFLTQGYAVLLPLWVALRRRRLPHHRLIAALILVLAGVAVLSGFEAGHLVLGRGEWETLAAAVVFTVQILLLDQPRYAANHPWRMTALALLLSGVLLAVPALLLAPSLDALLLPARHPGAGAVLAVLVLIPTLAGIGLMFAYQRLISPVAAGITYCSEPVFASAAALWLPTGLSALLGISYADEWLGPGLLLGGSLVAAGVVLAHLAPQRVHG